MSYHVLCGCYYQTLTGNHWIQATKQYLPLVRLEAHTTIWSTTSRTTLTQVFSNPSLQDTIKECIYTFPLYDGVSVVSFTCRIGSRVLHGLVKEKNKARAVYQEAVSRGETAGLLEQLPEAADVFSTKLGNIPAGGKVAVEITYVGELKHDAETDGTRFTLPTRIAPRYGSLPSGIFGRGTTTQEEGGIKITVDATVPEGSFIRSIQSPTHPIAVTMGTTSTAPRDDPAMHRASATLSLGTSQLDKDFVLIVLAKDTGVPTALLETHRTIKDQRALMVTLVPKFSLPPSRPEIIFVVDRSGSMQTKMTALKSAMKVFLKSLPVGVKFNICSFGRAHSFLWTRSKSYGQITLDEAISHVEGFKANYGGTETYAAMVAAVESRFKDLPCEVMLLTDGEIWNQGQLFTYLETETRESKGGIRIFALGIGDSVSHALVEGIARAGNGFAQSVGEREKLDSKVVRMLKGGLSPHITDYTLEVEYEANIDEDEEYEMVEKVTDGLQLLFNEESSLQEFKQEQKPISLYDPSADTEHEDKPISTDMGGMDRYTHLPAITTPKLLQSPSRIPPLFPFARTTVYLLISPQALQRTPKSVVLRGTSPHGPLELSMPVEILPQPGETLHQLAAKKAIQELEEGRGWIFDAKDENGVLIKDKFPGRFDEMVEREGIKLGVEFQVGGKWCSFVAVEANAGEIADKDRLRELASHQDNDSDSSTLNAYSPTSMETDQPFVTLARQRSTPAGREYHRHALAPAAKRSAKGSSQTTRKSALRLFGGTPSLLGAQQESASAAATSGLFGQPAPSPAHGSFGSPALQSTSGRQQWNIRSASLQQPGSSSGLFGAVRQVPLASPQYFGSAQTSDHATDGSSPFAYLAPLQQQQQSSPALAPSAAFGSIQKVSNCARETSKSVANAQPAPPPAPSAPTSPMQRSYKCSLPQASLVQDPADKSPVFGMRGMQERNTVPREHHKTARARSARMTPASDDELEDMGTLVTNDEERVHRIIELQHFEGCWDLNEEVAHILGFESLQQFCGGREEKTRGKEWATLLVVAFLEKRMREFEDVWDLVVEKAKGWLELQGGVEEARDLLGEGGRGEEIMDTAA